MIWRHLAIIPDQFEQLVAEILEKQGFDVLWLPCGRDQGIDIVAGSKTESLLIDVKRYDPKRAVGVEIVRHVYGVAATLKDQDAGRKWRGGIITSSRFTSGASEFSRSGRVRPLLRDGNWLKNTLREYVPTRV
jgi:restriction endonuclease Mrr